MLANITAQTDDIVTELDAARLALLRRAASEAASAAVCISCNAASVPGASNAGGAAMTQDDDDKPVALIMTEEQLREAVRRLYDTYLARGYHNWSYWRGTEDADAALLDILLDYADDDAFGRVWVEARDWADRPGIRPATGKEGVVG